MSLVSGAQLGSYEVIGPLGAGGMGEVYRARDVKLQRDVALKIVPESLARDEERLARFTREAQTLAALNHPNIAAIYGIEDSSFLRAIVMELVEGEDLSRRIARGALPADEAVAIARQLAEALEAAHDAGIVHRDLKPANVMVRTDGTVKVLDFGLAKVTPSGPRGASADAMNSPTFTSPAMTAAGVLLGTAPYIAPEIAKGRPADKRADIWAYGVVVYEMLAGRRLFAGDSAMEALAAVLRAEIDWSALPPSTPAPVRHLLARCLEPDPRLRLRDIGEARILLSAPQTSTSVRAASVVARRSLTLAIAAGVLLCLAAAAVAWRLKPASAAPVRILEISSEIPGPFALSPDGSAFAYLGGGHLYVQTFTSLEPQDFGEVAPGPNQQVFWSPDGKWIAYTAESMLRRVPASGGSPFVICAIPGTGAILSGAWLADGTIAFAVWRESLYKVSASGGTPSRILAVNPASEVDFHHVASLPDGRLIIATHRRTDGLTQQEILDGTRRTILTEDGTIDDVLPTKAGLLLFLRGGANRGLWAAPSATDSPDLSNAVLVQADAEAYSAANDGTLLVRVRAAIKSSLAWAEPTGRITRIPGDPVQLGGRPGLALSRDGQRVAFIVNAHNALNLVVRDLQTGADTPFTFNRSTDVKGTWRLSDPAWFPAGDRLVYASGGVETASRIFEQRLDPVAPPRELVQGTWAAVFPDGRSLFTIEDVRARGKLSKLSIRRDGSVGPAEVLTPDLDVYEADASPDGTLAAIGSRDESGHRDIVLARLDGSARRRITTGGATRPRFSADGRWLYYVEQVVANGRPGGRLVRVSLTSPVALEVGKVEVVLGDSSASDRLDVAQYDIGPDDRRFLVPVEEPGRRSRAVLVQNWRGLVAGR